MSASPDQYEIDRPAQSAAPAGQKFPEAIRQRLIAEQPFDQFHAPFADHCIGLALAVLALLLVHFTQAGIGWSWDEAYYYSPSKKAVEYFSLLATRPESRLKLLGGDLINYYWNEIHECPALSKLLFGCALRWTNGNAGNIAIIRLPSAILFGLTLYLIYLLAAIFYGRYGGLIAAIVYLTLPRVFGHAHIAATETLTNFMLVLCVYLFLRGLNRGGWAVLWGIAFGLALNTKINALTLPLALLPWALLYRRKQSANNLFALLLLAPLVWILTWPWLWDRTLLRMLEYIAFFAQHQITGVYYLGRQWGYQNYPPPPWHYPLVLILVSTPLLSLALFGAGALRAFANTRLKPYGMLCFLIVLVDLGLACRPDAPKYDGVRLILPVFPFLAILAGGAGALLPQAFSAELVEEGRRLRWNQLAALGFTLLLLGCGAVSLWYTAPRYLSYFNVAVGGIRGAAKNPQLSFETCYWGDAVDQQVIDYLNHDLPPECKKIKPLALHGLVFLQQQQVFDNLRKDLIFDGEPPYDAHILQHRQGFFGRAEKLLLRDYQPAKTFAFRGVPMISIYLTPGGLGARPAVTESAPTPQNETQRAEERTASGTAETLMTTAAIGTTVTTATIGTAESNASSTTMIEPVSAENQMTTATFDGTAESKIQE